MLRCALGILLLAAGVVYADGVIYRSEGGDGRPSFSDRPEAGAKPVDLPPVNTLPPPAVPQQAEQPAGEAFAGYEVRLAAPATVANGLVPTSVQIAVEPELRPGHRWQLFLDGKLVAQGDDSSHKLEPLNRGPHQLLLQVVDSGGKVLGSDGPVDLFVLRPGKN